jgi:hypothetical protein
MKKAHGSGVETAELANLRQAGSRGLLTCLKLNCAF